MMSSFKKGMRTLQSFVPWLKPLKDDFYYLSRKMLARPHDPDFRALPLLRLDPAGQYVDVGANHGQSIESIGVMRPKARIVAFEPNPALADKLRRRYASEPRVEIRALGLADQAGTMTLFSPSYRGFDYDGLASLDRHAAADWINAQRVYFFDPSRIAVRKLDCAISTLDAEGLEPAFLKIDVQGFEYHVLRGGVETLRRCEPVVLVEDYNLDSRSVALMSGLGFVEYYFDGARLCRGRSPGLNSFLMTGARARTAGL